MMVQRRGYPAIASLLTVTPLLLLLLLLLWKDTMVVVVGSTGATSLSSSFNSGLRWSPSAPISSTIRYLSGNHDHDEKDHDDADDDDDHDDHDHNTNQEEEDGHHDHDHDDTLWLAHGSLMAISWGLLVPLAIGSSLLRSLVGNRWFLIHQYTQLLAFLCSSVGFCLAVYKVQMDDGGDNHFDGGHKVVGLVIYILLWLQVLSGICRPHLPGQHVPQQEETGDKKEDITSNGDGPTMPTPQEESSREEAPAAAAADAAISSNDAHHDEQEVSKYPPPPESTFTKPELSPKSLARRFFEVQHRLLGVILVCLAWLNCSTGIMEVFEDDNYSMPLGFFWGVTGIISLGIGLLRCIMVQNGK